MVTQLDILLESCKYKENETKIVSIDVGIINMAIISATVTDKRITSVDVCDLVNIKEETENCCDPMCSLNHEKNALDWVHHFIIKYKTELDKANRILIEQQPPHGLQHIELLLIKEYRSKITNIYPRAFHTWMLFNNNISYEDRKKIIVARAEPYLKDMPSWSKNTDRQHDMADALCFILMYTHKEVKQVTPIYNNEFNKIIESFSYDP